MRLVLVAVGKLRAPLRDVADDYLRRLRRFITVEERELREAGRAGNDEAQRTTEGERILDAVSAETPLILLDQRGTMWSSEQLADELERWRTEARNRALVIGGAAGVAPAVAGRAEKRWSLGPLTLPHEIARVLVIEQLYRASTILRGEPYHRGTP
jgi:23S rRNA (pseudouridine1915-N3)-methyltransferase